MLAELAAEVSKHLVPVLELDAEISRGQNLDHPALKLYVLFSTHSARETLRARACPVNDHQRRLAPLLLLVTSSPYFFLALAGLAGCFVVTLAAEVGFFA